MVSLASRKPWRCSSIALFAFIQLRIETLGSSMVESAFVSLRCIRSSSFWSCDFALSTKIARCLRWSRLALECYGTWRMRPSVSESRMLRSDTSFIRARTWTGASDAFLSRARVLAMLSAVLTIVMMLVTRPTTSAILHSAS